MNPGVLINIPGFVVFYAGIIHGSVAENESGNYPINFL